MKGSYKGGFDFAMRYLTVILLAFTFIILMVYFFAWNALGENDTFPLPSLIKAVLPALLPFGLLTIVAFMAGYCPPGSIERYYIRLIMDIFKIFCIFYTSHSFQYVIDSMIFDDAFGINISNMIIDLDLTIIALILTILPALSLLDGLLEYRQNREKICRMKSTDE